MTWSLPTPDDRVEWSLWTSSNDSSSQALKSEFKETMTALGQHQYFTPYYQVHTYRQTYIQCGAGRGAIPFWTDHSVGGLTDRPKNIHHKSPPY